jgi:hypothetical protein
MAGRAKRDEVVLVVPTAVGHPQPMMNLQRVLLGAARSATLALLPVTRFDSPTQRR